MGCTGTMGCRDCEVLWAALYGALRGDEDVLCQHQAVCIGGCGVSGSGAGPCRADASRCTTPVPLGRLSPRQVELVVQFQLYVLCRLVAVPALPCRAGRQSSQHLWWRREQDKGCIMRPEAAPSNPILQCGQAPHAGDGALVFASDGIESAGTLICTVHAVKSGQRTAALPGQAVIVGPKQTPNRKKLELLISRQQQGTHWDPEAPHWAAVSGTPSSSAALPALVPPPSAGQAKGFTIWSQSASVAATFCRHPAEGGQPVLSQTQVLHPLQQL